jgi:hypothetical protein
MRSTYLFRRESSGKNLKLKGLFFFCSFRFESCGCLYNDHWRLTWLLTLKPVKLVEVQVNWSEHSC